MYIILSNISYCQKAVEISPLHFVSVEMTQIVFVTSSVVEESLVKQRLRFLRSTPLRSRWHE